MNRAVFESLIHSEPGTRNGKYLFLTDSEEMAGAILVAGFSSLLLKKNTEGYFDLDSLEEYLDKSTCGGTCRESYVYVMACMTKANNDRLKEMLLREALDSREGWQLFYEKEYLAKPESRQELTAVLERFIDRFEGRPDEDHSIDRFHRFNDDGRPVGVLDLEIVDFILKKIPFFVLGTTPFVYRDGVYEEDVGGIRLKAEIQKLIFRELVTSPVLNRVYSLLISQPSVQKQFQDLYNQPPEWINFRNGFYDPIRRTMHPHDPKYLVLNQIPHSYSPAEADNDPEGKTIQAFLDSSLPDPVEQKMMWEYLGYCMTMDTRMQKFLMLLGNGGTGKSVLISLFQQVIGIGNCSSISLQDLNRRFYATGLFGKQLNACGDISCKAMEQTDVIKKAVGEDTLIFERKGQDALQFMSRAKLLFSANDMPENLEEKSDAFYRRLLILDMNHVVTAEKKDTRLKEKFRKEIPYAIRMAMVALSGLYERGSFTESDLSKMRVTEIQKASDSVKAFIEDMLEAKKNSRIQNTKMYEHYCEYCADNGRQPLGKKRFFGTMRAKGYYGSKSNGIWYFSGISLKETEFEPADDEDHPFR